MAHLKIRLFGSFQVHLNEAPITKFESNKVRALLAYLAVESLDSHSREQLAALLWPEMPAKRASSNLSQALYNLRHLFQDHQATPSFLLRSRDSIQFNRESDYWLDIEQFNRNLIQDQALVASNDGYHENLQRAIDLYRGDFLEGLSFDSSLAFDEWLLVQRQRYQRQVVAGLHQLASYYAEQDELPQALTCAWRQVELDPLDERACRQLMGLLAANDQRSQALTQFERLQVMLAEELNVTPEPETLALRDQIRGEEQGSPKSESTVGNLPAFITPLIGRCTELAELQTLIHNPDCRLITLLGPGGIGKTRLAIAYAQQELETDHRDEDSHLFPDGVCFVRLESIDSAGQITREIAQALNLLVLSGGQADDGIDQQLFGYLHRKRMLLVLDNFEQLLAGVPTITELLQSAPGIRILITSRERLRLQGEQVFSLEGLTYPRLASVDDPGSYTAIQLFVHSARRQQPEFELTAGNITALVQICRLLEGMPLGLELAASWVGLLTLEEIGTEIQKNIGFLESDWVDLPERHRSLLAVCETIWQLMQPAEQTLFARLSVFRGGFTRVAAREVAGAAARDLQTLRSKSILDYDRSRGRYRIHPYLRQYGAERLSENPQEEFQTRDAHSAFFCVELEKQNDIYESGLLHKAVKQIKMEFANIQRAWDWAVAQGNLARIDQGIQGLCHYLLYGGHGFNCRYSEGLRLCELVNEKLSSQIPSSSSDKKLTEDEYSFNRVHAKVICSQGYFSTFFDEDQAGQLYEKSLGKLNKLEAAGYDVRLEKAQVLILMSGRGPETRYHANPESSKRLLLESISLLQDTEHYWRLFFGMDRLGETCYELGSYREAINWFEQGYALAKKHHNQWYEITFLSSLGNAGWKCRDYNAAFKFLEKALTLAKIYQSPDWVIDIISDLGSVCLFLGYLVRAASYYQQAIAFVKESGLQDRDGHFTFDNLCVVQWLTGAFEEAEATILRVADFPQNLSDTMVVYPNSGYTELLALTGRYREAAEKIGWADKYLDVSGWPDISNRLFRVSGWLALVDQRYTEASEHFGVSIECFKRDDSIAWSQAGMAGAEFGLDHRDRARDLLTEALFTSIEIQSYIPMVFALPMTLLILAEEDRDLATYVYQQVKGDPFLGQAQLFHDLVYQHLPEEITSCAEFQISGGPVRREALWATAKLIHKKWGKER